MTTLSPDLRDKVRQRAGNRCEYCLKPDSVEAYPFHVDHILALKHEGETEFDNLAWACFHCNIAKGTDVASYDTETGTLVPYYNPRIENWHEHFERSGAFILGKTATGRVTVRMLQLNEEAEIETRLQLIAAGLW